MLIYLTSSKLQGHVVVCALQLNFNRCARTGSVLIVTVSSTFGQQIARIILNDVSLTGTPLTSSQNQGTTRYYSEMQVSSHELLMSRIEHTQQTL
jgi:hypothetical protein